MMFSDPGPACGHDVYDAYIDWLLVTQDDNEEAKESEEPESGRSGAGIDLPLDAEKVQIKAGEDGRDRERDDEEADR